MRELNWEPCREPFDAEYREKHFICLGMDVGGGEVYFDDNNKPLTFYTEYEGIQDPNYRWYKAAAPLARPREES